VGSSIQYGSLGAARLHWRSSAKARASLSNGARVAALDHCTFQRGCTISR